jgi:Uma2 family endonuclease
MRADRPPQWDLVSCGLLSPPARRACCAAVHATIRFMEATRHQRPAKSMTPEEWAALPEDEAGELVDGVLVEEEMPSFIHECVVGWLYSRLLAWAVANGARAVLSGLKFGVSERSGRMPDLTVFLRDARRPPPTGLVRVPPSIAVEVISPTPSDHRRDRVAKLDDYAAFGVRWYWLVDPELRTFEVLELGPDHRYVHALGATEGVIALPGCPGLELDLDALWAEVDAAISESSGG